MRLQKNVSYALTLILFSTASIDLTAKAIGGRRFPPPPPTRPSGPPALPGENPKLKPSTTQPSLPAEPVKPTLSVESTAVSITEEKATQEDNSGVYEHFIDVKLKEEGSLSDLTPEVNINELRERYFQSYELNKEFILKVYKE